jgi:putative membrane protein
MKRMGFLSLVFATVVAVGCNGNNHKDIAAARPAGDPSAVGTAGEADRNKVSSGDKDFVRDLTIANMAEVELGKMANERSTNAEVKKFGQMMVDDHTAAGDKLKAVASQYNIPVPAALDDKHQDLREKLAKLQGADFDREYMSAMVDGHEKVSDTLESRIDKTDLGKWKTETADPASGKKVVERAKAVTVRPEKSDEAVTMSINQWAADAYPVVQAHLQAAKALDAGLKNRTTH